jgi:hypothetical protein
MDANRIAWNVGGWKKGEPHNVIPMHMGHEEVIDLGRAWAVLTHDLLPKAAQPRAHITDHVRRATNEFHTCRVATIAMPCWEIELFVDETLDLLVVGKASTVGV